MAKPLKSRVRVRVRIGRVRVRAVYKRTLTGCGNAWRSGRLHSVFTALAQRCWRLHSAHLGVLQFVDAVGTP